MIEKYIIEKNKQELTINYGKYTELVHKKQIASYGEDSANNILENIKNKFNNSLIQLNNPDKNNNILFVGKVQSGKTSSLEMFTALAFDNGYQMSIIYGGYDSSLLSQTRKRFSKTFDVPQNPTLDDENAIVFSTEDTATLNLLNADNVSTLISSNRPIILLTMKRPDAMKKVNAFLKRIQELKIKAFIIDDEGDQASLNTKKDKQNDASATYREIKHMKKALNDPLYLAVTATPQANIFLNEYSAVKPDDIMLIDPAVGYCGASVYHQTSDLIDIVNDDISDITSGISMPNSLRNAINYFIVASAIKKNIASDKKANYSDMIVHSHRTTTHHKILYNMINSYIEDLKNCILYDSSDLGGRLNIFKNCYDEYFYEKYNANFSFNNIKENILTVIKQTKPILKNSKGGNSQIIENLTYHKIYVGGDLLQRGVTFENLITTYFTRWAKTGGNMDTNLQRARWFGYRSKYIDLCKIFMTKDISVEFYGLAETEEDLWEQFYQIEQHEKNISDVVIVSPEYSNQKPCRRNVADYKKLKFNNRWLKQKFCIADINQINHNNKLIEDLKTNYKVYNTTNGRKDGKVSASYVCVPPENLVNLLHSIEGIFENNPFGGIDICNAITKCSYDIPIVFIAKDNNQPRIRSLYPGDLEIKVLQQGADNIDPNKVIYEGDAAVIIDKNKFNMQIHKIEPYDKQNNKKYKEQYMFAIYSPSETSYYIKA
mgnify:FL=1